jgi:hypothetical protein
MKRLIVAAILFVVVIATYLTSLFYITDSCDKAKSMVENSISVYTKNQTAKKEARDLENYWNKKEPLLSVFVNHDRIDDIETAISLMNVYAKIPKNELFYEYADNVKMLIHQILEDTKFTMHSIF